MHTTTQNHIISSLLLSSLFIQQKQVNLFFVLQSKFFFLLILLLTIHTSNTLLSVAQVEVRTSKTMMNHGHCAESIPTHLALTVSQTDFLLIDRNGDGFVNPQETLRYTIYIENKTDRDLTQLRFQSDQYTKCIIGSVTASNGNIKSGNNIGDTQVIVAIAKIKAGERQSITYDMIVGEQSTTKILCQGTVYSPELGYVLTDDIHDPRSHIDPTVTMVVSLAANVEESIICIHE